MLFWNIRRQDAILVLDFYFRYSLYPLVLDLSLANQLQNYTRCSLTTLADTISLVLPVLTIEYQCHQKDYYLPDYFWITTDYFGSSISVLPKRLCLTDTSSSHWIWKHKFLSKPCCYFLLIIFDQRVISHPCGSFWPEIILLNFKITTEKYWFQILNEIHANFGSTTGVVLVDLRHAPFSKF